MHLESWKGLLKSGVHVPEQEVNVNRTKVMSKLFQLNNVIEDQIREYKEQKVQSPERRNVE